MGRSRKLTWPMVNDIKNPKYANCRHLCPYCTLRVSKSSDHWCAFGAMSNFEKRNLRSGHLMWPGGVIFGVIGSSFFWKCVKLLAEQLWQIWRPFFRYLRKTWGGGGLISAPPAVRGFSEGRWMVRGAPGSWKAQMEKKIGSYTRRLEERQTF